MLTFELARVRIIAQTAKVPKLKLADASTRNSGFFFGKGEKDDGSSSLSARCGVARATGRASMDAGDIIGFTDTPRNSGRSSNRRYDAGSGDIFGWSKAGAQATPVQEHGRRHTMNMNASTPNLLG